jgi:hypothetical protein
MYYMVDETRVYNMQCRTKWLLWLLLVVVSEPMPPVGPGSEIF